MRVYRGTQREKVRGQQKVTSWTPSLPVAVIYAAHPGDTWGTRPAEFLPTSTIHIGEVSPDARQLWLCDDESYCGLRDLMKALQYGEPNGMTYDEGWRLLTYLHKRSVGQIEGGDFSYGVYDGDEDLWRDPRDVELSFIDPETLISQFREDDYYEGNTDVDLYVDAFVFADSPTVRNIARRLGYDILVYQDVFLGGEYAAPELLGCEVSELDGVDVGTNLEYLRERDEWAFGEEEEVPVHETFRPLTKHAIKTVGSVQVAEVLPQVRCTAQGVTNVKARLLR